MAPFTHSRHPLARGLSRWHCKFSESRISYRSVHLPYLARTRSVRRVPRSARVSFPLPLPPRPLTHLSHRGSHCFRILLCVPSPKKGGGSKPSNETRSSDSVVTSWSRSIKFFLPRKFNLLWVASLRGNWSSGSSAQRRGNGGLNGGTINTLRSRLSGFFLLSVSNFPLERRFILQLE